MTDDEYNYPPSPEEISRHRNIMNIVDIAMKLPRQEYSDEEVIADLEQEDPETGVSLLKNGRFLNDAMLQYKAAKGGLLP